MPRPGYRWTRRRRALSNGRPVRVAKPCPIARIQEGRRLETRVMEISGIRHELVSHVRRQIVAGTYDTIDKLEAAMDRLFARMADD